MKISVLIPYFKKIDSIKYTLRSLKEQTFDNKDFEVVIGCLEHSHELLGYVEKHCPELKTVLIMSNEYWNASRARNVAINQARGEVLVFLDTDVIVNTRYLEHQYRIHRDSSLPQLLIGQTRDYNEGSNTEKREKKSFDFYLEYYLRQTASKIDLPMDIRWKIPKTIDWALGWTFNLSIARQLIVDKSLFFDEDSNGWGVEDTEWVYRVKKSGAKIVFSEDLWAIHLPHDRDIDSNHTGKRISFRKMLEKWPTLEVEIVTALGDIVGNENYNRIIDNVARLCTDEFSSVCTIEFLNQESEERYLYVGACINNDRKTIYHNYLPSELKRCYVEKILSLMGMSLPYDDKTFDKVFLCPKTTELDEDYLNKIVSESKRLSSVIISMEEKALLTA